MKASPILSLGLAGLAAASPIGRKRVGLKERQLLGGQRSDLDNGECRDITLIFARGSTELPNLGMYGQPLAQDISQAYGDDRVAVQGVDYAAGLTTNVIGGDPAGIAESERLFNMAHEACPDTIIVAGGYSQGAALMHRSIENLDEAVKEQIAGVVTFGDTYNAQDGGTIPSLDPEKVKVFCKIDDGVCSLGLAVTAGHLSYATDVPDAADFLQSRIDSVSGGGGDSGSATTDSGAAGGLGSLFGGGFARRHASERQ